MKNIENRRYIGNKNKLKVEIFNKIHSVVKEIGLKNPVFGDLFAGTGVVSEYFGLNSYKLVINDLLYSNFVAYNAWFSSEKYSIKKINNFLEKYNALDPKNLKENYFSKIYSGKYFSRNDSKKIGYIRDDIEKNKKILGNREYFILIASLMYSVDKIANTVGHFEHFLKSEPKDSNFNISTLNLQNTFDSIIFNEDANNLIKKIKVDVLYIDPPYNARQYINFYHVLENLAIWEKPIFFEGVSMKFKRNHLKSGYSRSIAKDLMKDLVDNARAKIIAVSYNNTYNAKSSASNNKISETEMLSILESKGEVTKYEFSHKHFNAGKTNFLNHIEKLFICIVR